MTYRSKASNLDPNRPSVKTSEDQKCRLFNAAAFMKLYGVMALVFVEVMPLSAGQYRLAELVGRGNANEGKCTVEVLSVEQQKFGSAQTRRRCLTYRHNLRNGAASNATE